MSGGGGDRRFGVRVFGLCGGGGRRLNLCDRDLVVNDDILPHIFLVDPNLVYPELIYLFHSFEHSAQQSLTPSNNVKGRRQSF